MNSLKLLFVLIFITAKLSFGQSYFNKAYSLPSVDANQRTEGFGPIIEIPATGYLGACQSWNFSNGDTRLVFFGIDYNGDTLFTKSYYDSLWFPTPGTLNFTTDSNLVLGCGVSSYGDDTTRFYLFKLNQTADTIWTKKYSSGLIKTTHRKTNLTSDGGYVMCGWTGNASNQRPTYGYVVKTDSVGNKLWDHQYGDSTKFNVATCCIELNDGGYFILMWSSGQNTYDRDIILIRTDNTGNEIWQHTYGNSGLYDNGERIRQLKDGNFLIAGTKCLGPAVNQNPKAYLLKIDSLGSVIWDKFYGSYIMTELYEFYELNDSSIITGTVARTQINPTINNGTLLKCDYNGDSLWMRTYLYDTIATSGNDYAWTFIPTSDSGFLLGGQTTPGPSGTQDAWLIKVDSVGCDYGGCIPVGQPEQIPQLINIKATPNPTTGNFTIQFNTQPTTGIVQLYNINSKLVLQQNIAPYSQYKHLNITNLPQGIYLCKLKWGNIEVSVKIIKAGN